MLRRGPGLVRTVGRTAAIAGTATAVSGRVAHRQQAKYADQEQAQYEQAPPPPPQQYAPPPPPPQDAGGGTDMAELQQLAELHAQGVLTDEEFAAKKAQILGI